jgi:DNA-binding XRE family transcriptional regulator
MRINHLALRAIRERSGLTQTAVAKAAQLNRANYAHIEAGRRPCPAESALLIAAVLGVPVGAIVSAERVA